MERNEFMTQSTGTEYMKDTETDKDNDNDNDATNRRVTDVSDGAVPVIVFN